MATTTTASEPPSTSTLDFERRLRDALAHQQAVYVANDRKRDERADRERQLERGFVFALMLINAFASIAVSTAIVLSVFR